MCKLAGISASLILIFLALADAFFMPVFYRKQDPVQATPPSQVQAQQSSPSVSWGRSPHLSSYPYSYNPSPYPAQQVPISPMPPYSYEATSSMMVNPYRQMQMMEPQFHNVQLVPCMCPITREVIEQQIQSMQSSGQASGSSSQESTKLGVVPSSSKTS